MAAKDSEKSADGEEKKEDKPSTEIVKRIDDKEKGNVATAAAAALSAAAVKAKVLLVFCTGVCVHVSCHIFSY